MPIGNQRPGNTYRGNEVIADDEAVVLRSDMQCRVENQIEFLSDLSIDFWKDVLIRSDMKWHVNNIVEFQTDIRHIVSAAVVLRTDIGINVFNPLPIEFRSDLLVDVFNPQSIEFKTDISIDVGELVDFSSDMELETVVRADFWTDLEFIASRQIVFLTDIQFNVITDPNNPDVLKINSILERRWLRYMPEHTMIKPGPDTERFKIQWTVATAIFNSRENLDRLLKALRLMLSKGSALDRVADRVGERRWQFYTDRVDRHEGDDCFRKRLIPYFQESRGTLESLRAAVAPLHECYGGQTRFYSYQIGHGWTLGVQGRTELGETTYLGGPLLNLNPLIYLVDAQIWIMGESGHTELGYTTYLGDRERLLTPFAFIVEVFNYPDVESWKQLLIYTIDRFKLAGTVPVIVFRTGIIMQHQVFTANGTADYTITGTNQEGRTVIVTVDAATMTPDESYTVTNDGANTLLHFAVPITAGLKIVVYYWSEP